MQAAASSLFPLAPPHVAASQEQRLAAAVAYIKARGIDLMAVGSTFKFHRGPTVLGQVK